MWEIWKQEKVGGFRGAWSLDKIYPALEDALRYSSLELLYGTPFCIRVVAQGYDVEEYFVAEFTHWEIVDAKR